MPSPLEVLRKDRLFIIYGICIILSVIAFGIINYCTYTPGVNDEYPLWSLLLWSYLYVPLFLLKIFNGWKVTDFGFVMNRRVVITVGVSGLIAGWVFFASPEYRMSARWEYSLLEAFARVGEEVFFRGFVYLYFEKLFSMKNRPHVWAIILSSIAFTLPHTHTFLPGVHMPISTVIMAAILMAYLRHKTGSILPAILIHCFVGSDLLGALFGLAIYSLFIMGVGMGGFRFGPQHDVA
jgi:membrane protease YdiL (CAAX protease family)